MGLLIGVGGPRKGVPVGGPPQRTTPFTVPVDGAVAHKGGTQDATITLKVGTGFRKQMMVPKI